jgi:hypothetical protein
MPGVHFLDTSALAKRYIAEVGSAWLPVEVWWVLTKRAASVGKG